MGSMFLLSFLLYPSLTGKIFDAFLCRDFGYGKDRRGPYCH